MSDFGPITMKQHLKSQAKKLERMERGLGALLRPKPGQPSFPTGVAVDAGRLNDLSRYGGRLVVFSFAYLLPSALALNQVLATLPDSFRPGAVLSLVAVGNLGAASIPVQMSVDVAGNLRFLAAGAAVTAVAGTVTFTATL